MSGNLEREYKLRATETLEIAAVDAAIRECGAQCRESRSVRHRDVYLDDAAGSLEDLGIGLRIRTTDNQRELTFKSKQRGHGHLFVRTEFDASWPLDQPPRLASELPTAIRAAVQRHIEERPLVQKQELVVHREIRILHNEHDELCELAMDSVTAHAAGHQVSFQEIELEVRANLEANRILADRLRARLPLTPAMMDKPSYAASLLAGR